MIQHIAIVGFELAANSSGALKESPAITNKRIDIKVGSKTIKDIKNFISAMFLYFAIVEYSASLTFSLIVDSAV